MSVWPVAVMRALPLVLKASAACLMVVSAWCDRFERSQSKNTMNDGGVTIGGGGGGGGGAEPNFSWMLPSRLMLLLLQPKPATVGFVVP